MLVFATCRGENQPSSPNADKLVSPEGLVFQIDECEVTHDKEMPRTDTIGRLRWRQLSVWAGGRVSDHRITNSILGRRHGSHSLVSPQKLIELTKQARTFVTMAPQNSSVPRVGDKYVAIRLSQEDAQIQLVFVKDIPKRLLALMDAVRAEVNDRTNKLRAYTKRKISFRRAQPEKVKSLLERLKRSGLLEQFVHEGLIPPDIARGGAGLSGHDQ